MSVTRIEVFGFKSFMDRLVLPVSAGISGVVGPNGCGKSNIVDALRWVLGETRARSLRGAIAEDVIFNGTEKLRPLGLAEVSITVAAQNENFFDDVVAPGLEADNVIDSIKFEDDAVTKYLNADAEAEKSSQESQDKTETDRPRFTVIDGGASDTAQKEDAVEEEPKETSSRASSLVDRFSWLRSANEVQVTRRLYRSGESEYFINRVACRLKDIVELFRAIGMGARAYNIVAQGEISRIVTAKPEEKRTIIEEAAGVLGFRDRIAATNRRLKETETSISRIADIVKEVERNVSSLKRQAAKARNRESLRLRVVELEELLYRDRFVRLSTDRSSLDENLSSLKEKQADIDVVLVKVQAEEHEARSKLMSIDVESDAIRAKIDSIREDLNNRERQAQARKSRLQELIALERAAETETVRLKERESTLHERKTNCDQAIVTLSQSEGQIAEEISGLESGSELNLKNAAEELNKAREAVKSIDAEIRTLREKLVADESRLGALSEQLKAASPAVKLQETMGEEGRGFLNRAVGLLVDGLKVPEKYAAAIQAVLAEKTSYLVSEDFQDLNQTFVNQVLQKERHSKKGVAFGIFKTGNALANRVPTLRSFCGDGVVPAFDVVGRSPQFELAASNLLCEVYCADTFEIAQQFLEKIKDQETAIEPTIVTLEGDVLTRFSFYSLRHDGGLVQLKNRIADLENSCAQMKAKQEEYVQTKSERQETLVKSEEHHSQMLRESQDRARLVKELSQKLGSARGRLQAEQRLVEQIGRDLARTAEQAQDTAQRIKDLKTEQDSVKAQITNEVTEEEKDLRAELEILNQKSLGVESLRREGRQALSDVSERLASVRRELDSIRSEDSQAALEFQKIDLELNHLKELALDHIGPDSYDRIAQLASSDENLLLEADTISEYQDEVSKLRARIIREGEVDSSSIERCDEETKRLEDLVQQKSDLEEAYRTLQRTVERLTEISQERFVKTFEAVNTNFSQLVPKIFGGGSAHLEMTDPSNPLESGVEIIARPPGKKLKSIELLSGGEKTLCAISLIIGMFLVRPSPICVLDEVDAPLDEANVGRFLSLIKEMSTKTQFLLITHNKQTMSVCDNLVGVTMEQPGSSKIVTVSLEEAYSHAVNS